ncbi:branched-chain amino acid ABC transporter permease [Tardiphaga robiniae]|uniref:Branched-chain amino acid ABC transporter permease n=1 Tax=Tardiphaga robiniae TaxID=943830 RepID=A0A7G6TXG4_9BRAD|nr:branched-chain amino acid ABC transporter permease [Tardiphaga robiniae]QND71446.1 branched-chain amino acid ABC transporter permease [Tardiphaga robiniae]
MTRLPLIISVAVFVVAAILPILLGDGFVYHLGILVGIQAILALSLHLMLRIRQLSLAQAGFMGVGAYTSALLSRDLGLAYPLALLAAIVVPAVIAALVGSIILRIKGVYFVLLTFALGEAIRLIFVEWVVPFGGNNGLTSIPAVALFSVALKSRLSLYLFTLGALGVCLLAAHLLLSREQGRVLHGVAHNELLMQSLGTDVTAYRRMTFVLSAAIAGVAGSIYAHYLGFISPAAFNVTANVGALVLNVVGGASFLLGPVAGAVLLVPLPELFRDAVVYQSLFYGLALLALTLSLPRGLLGLLMRRG